MAKKNKKVFKSNLKLEALEQRQLLAGISGSGTELTPGGAGADKFILAPNGNKFDQVLLTGTSVSVTNDVGNITRVSFLDLQGDIVQAEFSGSGTLTVSLDSASAVANVAPAKYNQSGVLYEQGLATFTVQGSDSTTNLSIFSVGSATAFAGNTLFDTTHTGGNGTADVSRITLVANPSNPNGSTFGGIRAGNAVFTSDNGVTGGVGGVIGITASNVQVQDVVTIGEINATGTATPTLVFGTQSQFGTLTVAGGGLLSTNGAAINDTGSYQFGLALTAGTKSDGTVIAAKTTQAQIGFTAYNPVAASIKNFALTTGIDSYVGTSGTDVINANETSTGAVTLTSLDNIDGGPGSDLITLTQTGSVTIPTNVTVANIETANITAGTTVAGSLSPWSGLTTANVVSDAGSTSETFAVGNSTALTFNNTTTAFIGTAANQTGGAINLSGGNSTTVTNTLRGDNNFTITGGAIAISGNSNKTVSVTQTAPTSATSSRTGIVDGAVSITSTGLTDATITNAGATTVSSDALANLTLNGTVTSTGITYTKTSTTTLNLNVNGGSIGAITDSSNQLTTLNINAVGDSTIAQINDTATKTLNVSGSKNLTLTSATGLTNLTTVNLTGSGANKATLTGANTTAINASTSTGANTITIDGTKASYTGGSGVDNVTIGADPTRVVDGGAGSADVLTVNFAGVYNPSGNSSNVKGFEILAAGNLATSLDATGFTGVAITGAVAAPVTFSNVNPGTALTISSAPGQAVTYSLKDSSGSADAATVTLSSSGTLSLAANNVNLPGIESVTIQANDTDGTQQVDTIALVATSATSVTVTGKAGLTITNTGNTAITSFDASSVTNNTTNPNSAVTFVSANVSAGAAVTIKGGAGNDTLTGNDATIDTISGGGGDDTISGGKGLDILTGGAGKDTFIIATPANGNSYATITDLAAGDMIDLADKGTAVSVNGGTTFGSKITLASTAAFQDFLDAAASGDGSTNGRMAWFQYNGDTYVVEDTSASPTFSGGSDVVVKASGLVDLTNSTFVAATSVITIV